MLRAILQVSGLTLLSRITGFARDIIMAGVLGAGFLADAFVVAMKLPNHFRAIFAEGAFSAAYVPIYAGLLEKKGLGAAERFAGHIFTLLLATQIVFLLAALGFMPWIVGLLAPGFAADPPKFDLAVTLTRITFPFLLFMTLLTLLTGSLNAQGRFAAAAFAQVLLNLTMIAALAVSFLFPTAAHAAAWGVTASGVVGLLFIAIAAQRAGALPPPLIYRHGEEERSFFKAFLPAVVGSSGVQLAMFADTIISTYLPQGAPSSVYFADRIYQLPLGIIAIAAGTVLLPEMSRRLAAGDETAAHKAQSRAMAFMLVLTVPCVLAFLLIPDLIMKALFVRGKFTVADAEATARVLAAYGVGLPAVMLIQGAVKSFQSRGDTRTPVIASFTGIAVNIALKIILTRDLGAPGLALATSVGAWINLTLLCLFAYRGRLMDLDMDFAKILVLVEAAGALFAAALWWGGGPIERLLPAALPWRDGFLLMILGGLALGLYGVAVLGGLKVSGARLARA